MLPFCELEGGRRSGCRSATRTPRSSPDPRRHRRHLRRPGRRRRGELRLVRAGRRRGAADRRPIGRPDRARLQGPQRNYVIGTPSAGPIADTGTTRAKDFVAAYRRPSRRFPEPCSRTATSTPAALLALDEVKGDLSDGGKSCARSRHFEFETPTGMVSSTRTAGHRGHLPDRGGRGPRRQPAQQCGQGDPAGDQTMGVPARVPGAGPVGRDNPDCR